MTYSPLRFTSACLMNEQGHVVGRVECVATLLPNGTVDFDEEVAIEAEEDAEASWLLFFEEPPGTKQLVTSIRGKSFTFKRGDIFHLQME